MSLSCIGHDVQHSVRGHTPIAGCLHQAIGSRRTHADRVRRLRAAGTTDEQLARLKAPVGLDLGGPDSRRDCAVDRH
ncbi:XdhC family protein [Streptomyces sp. NPDC006527]|uniref:XdhC family protein n=1 Tax=Streptomyces sp. NPDC006527 TaxID=3364749 RepID=UPI00367601C6